MPPMAATRIGTDLTWKSKACSNTAISNPSRVSMTNVMRNTAANATAPFRNPLIGRARLLPVAIRLTVCEMSVANQIAKSTAQMVNVPSHSAWFEAR